MPVVVLLTFLNLAAAAQSGETLAGSVVDTSGAAVSNAVVRVDSSGAAVAETRTGNDGRFEIALTAADANLSLVVLAPGFAPSTTMIPAGTRTLQVTLQPAPFFEAVNVTSSRTDVPRVDPTATVTVITSDQLLSSGPLTIDDALKMVPGFTLFRRTSSRNANPTAQGVSLRGVGGTSPSRSLVLADGVPLNDAFGGWVFWDKVPQAAIDRIEVERGSGSDLYGADALGGVVQLLTMRPTRPTGRAVFEAGTLGTGNASLFGGSRSRGWRYSGAVEWFTTGGYIPVAVKQDPGIAPRGPVDSKAASTHRSALASAGYQADSGWRVEATGTFFSEDRKNGTPLSINTTDSRQGSVDVAGKLAGGLFTVRGYGGTQDYHQTFTTVNALRTSEALNRDQLVPTKFGGVGGQWFRAWGRHTLLFGTEGRYVDGKSIETPYAQGVAGVTISPGGTDRRTSGFVQDTWQTNDRLTVVLGAHGDTWSSKSKQTGFTNSSGAFNPRAALSYRVAPTVTVRGAVYHGFRAPTLNEFYRNFSAGSTLTRANEALDPERMTGGDVGVLVGDARASARVTAFWNDLNHAITSITLSSTPTQIIRQRANADRLQANGIELEGHLRLPKGFSLDAATGITSVHFTGNTNLRDKRVPQVPSYNVGVDLRYSRDAWVASTQLRVTGPQFEDDQNVFTLRRATVVDAFASRTIARRISAFVGIENLFDSTYDVGRTPVLTTGLPRTARLGIIASLP